jgi:kynurenine formamidase
MSRIIDLTLTLSEEIPNYSREISKQIPEDGWNASMIHVYSHTGTHMDCPYHFGLSDVTIDKIPPERFVADGILVKVPDVQPGMNIRKSVLDEFSRDELTGRAVLFHTGWSKHYKNPEIYRNQLPRISQELAQYMVDTGVSIVGVEPPSVSDVNNIVEINLIHKILLGGDVIIVEGLANLENLSGRPFRFIALPLKIEGGDGAPVRAIAIESE